ncbi:hypothetical protein B0T24DRAFT_321385 [Lasiosphaeria ovina]|uniref:Uncharacterized protein n=1 Tax=Lasiosphaeria ovina TaxID=92902 RepID=A0AAE0K7C2_9PEZI|nr:hypothetical protein B0T24DRAFT_321385 [Lasiosphaeria ovina]
MNKKRKKERKKKYYYSLFYLIHSVILWEGWFIRELYQTAQKWRLITGGCRWETHNGFTFFLINALYEYCTLFSSPSSSCPSRQATSGMGIGRGSFEWDTCVPTFFFLDKRAHIWERHIFMSSFFLLGGRKAAKGEKPILYNFFFLCPCCHTQDRNHWGRRRSFFFSVKEEETR